MLLERIIYSCLCIALMAYILKRYLKDKNNFHIVLLGFQVISVLVEILSVIRGVYPNYAMQLFILVFAVVIPGALFITNYYKFDLNEYLEIKIGDRHSKKEHYNKAIEYYQKALSRNPNNSETFVRLGKSYNAIGERRTAFDRFAKAVELNRNDYKSYYEIGIIFNELGKKADAKIVLDNSLRIKPDFTPASELLALVLCSLNKYDEAIHVYNEAIKYTPDNYQLYYSLGIVRTELRDFDEALECYKKAIKLKEDLFEAYFSMGQIYLLKGELEEAEKNFKQSVMDTDIAGKSYYQLAKVYILNNDEVNAISNIQYAIEIDPGFRYKAESEPLFQNIKGYLTGMHMVSQAQMKLEKAIDEKVKKEYEKEMDKIDIKDINDEDVEFNFMDKFGD